MPFQSIILRGKTCFGNRFEIGPYNVALIGVENIFNFNWQVRKPSFNWHCSEVLAVQARFLCGAFFVGYVL